MWLTISPHMTVVAMEVFLLGEATPPGGTLLENIEPVTSSWSSEGRKDDDRNIT